jgi:hypothetical protein
MLCHSCPLWIFIQEHDPHSITKAEALAMKQNITAQQNTVSHKKRFSMRPLIILHPKEWKKLNNQPNAQRLILTRVED